MTALAAFLLIVRAWLKKEALGFLVSHWPVIALVLWLLAVAAATAFAPAFDRPLILVIVIVAVALGVAIGKKYL